jgi:hypothetical protein
MHRELLSTLCVTLLAACPGTVGPDAGATVPSAPSGVTATADIRSAAVSWTAPTSNGGDAITGYTVASSPPVASATAVVTGTAASVTGLANGTAYTFTVAATNRVGTGPASAPSAAVTTAALPGAPTGVAAAAGNQTAAVSWTAPASDGGRPITKYTLLVSPASPAATFAINATRAKVSSLTNGTQYTFQVFATTAVGDGPPSAASNAVTPTATPLAPSNLTYSANPASYTVGTAILANVPSNSGGAIDSYAVSPALPAGLSLDTATGVITGTPTAVASGVYQVTGTNVSGSTAVSLSIAVTIPAPPTNLTYSSNPANYTLGVAIPANVPSNSGGPVASYSVTPALPAGLSLNTSTGVITGTPTAATPTAAYQVTATNAGGSTSASLSITVTQGTGFFPLTISTDRNGLVDATGKRFLMQGDAAWSAIAQLSEADAITYLNDRQSRGFNTILVNLVEHSFTSHTPNWKNANGDVPFTGTVPGSCPNTEGTSTCNDMSTTNDLYFAHVDWFLQQAFARNMLVLLVPAYLGFAKMTDGWFTDMAATGPTKLTAYGQYLGARYKNYPNIIWVNGGDYTPKAGSELGLVEAIVNGVKAAGATQLHTAHLGGEPSFPPYGLSPHPSWLDVDTVYVSNTPYNWRFTLEGWTADHGVRPLFFIEGYYENEHGTTPLQLRADRYQPYLSGEVGSVFGINPVWNFWDGSSQQNYYGNDGKYPNWQAALPSPGGANAARAAQFIASLTGWQNLAPDVGNTLVTAGGCQSADNCALASSTPDGKLAVVYWNAALPITVDMSKFAGPVTARWFDASSGAYTTVSGSPLANSGSRSFTLPGNTADGSADWVLLLQN